MRPKTRTAAKTNAMRALERLSIPYEVRTYEFEPDRAAAAIVAKKIGLPAEQVFKTLCLRSNHGSVLLALVAGDSELDLKALARVAGERNIAPVGLKELVSLTGYQRGAVTALACRKPYPVFLDLEAERHSRISISGGQRGLQVVLAPGDFVRASGAKLVSIARPQEQDGCSPALDSSNAEGARTEKPR